jgi:hypothetical protein
MGGWRCGGGGAVCVGGRWLGVKGRGQRSTFFQFFLKKNLFFSSIFSIFFQNPSQLAACFLVGSMTYFRLKMSLLGVLFKGMPICVFIAQNGLVNFPSLRIFSEIRLLQKVICFWLDSEGFWASLRHVQILAQKFAFLVHKKETGEWRSAI